MSALLIGGAAACSHSGDARKKSGEPEVVLATRAGELHVKVEIARNDPERQRGLMFRQKLESGRGMIFLFEHPERLKFWMKNTYIPLDMIFIGADKRVVGIEENAEPLTLQSRGPDDADSQFVLEVPGGWARTHGVERGVSVRFVDID
ncbi:MAG: hypothetical protein JWN44_6624 [Myxococcales bacterium]|nr:hypothetical protein [Myxococcales bacterium]